MLRERGKDAAKACGARRETHRDRQHVVDDERCGSEQAWPAPKVRLRDRIGAATFGVRGDHLGVGDDEQREHARDHERERQRPVQRARARGDQHDDHRFGPIGDARERVEAERGEPAREAKLVALVGVLASPQRRPSHAGKDTCDRGWVGAPRRMRRGGEGRMRPSLGSHMCDPSGPNTFGPADRRMRRSVPEVAQSLKRLLLRAPRAC